MGTRKILILLFLLAAVSAFADTAEEHFKKGIDLANSGKYDEAVLELKQALALEPKSYKCHLNLGLVYANQKRYDEAMKAIETAISINPDKVMDHYVLALLYERKKEKDKAVAEWEKVLKLKPDDKTREFAEKHIRWLKKQEKQ